MEELIRRNEGTKDQRDRYTDTPRQNPNLILGALHLLFWIWLHPSAWRHHVARIDPALPPDFSLVDLNRDHWRHPRLRRLLWQVYGVLPLLAAGFLAFLFLSTVPPPHYLPTVIHFTLVVFVISLLLGLVVSLAAGAVTGLTIGIGVGVLGVLGAGVLLQQLFLGLALGIAASANALLRRAKPAPSPARQMGAVTIGVLVALSVILARRQLSRVGEMSGLSAEVAYQVARGTMVGLSLGLVLNWRRGRLAGIGGGVAGGLIYVLIMLVTESDAPPPLRGVSSGVLYGTSLMVTLLLPYVLVTRLAGLWAAAWAGALASMGRHTFIHYVEGTVVWPAILAGLLGVVLGITAVWWRPVLLYPLAAAWNLLLYQADRRGWGRRGPLLPYHTAFWHEEQLLTLPGLDDHLLLVMESDPAEGEAALEYLVTGRQGWAAQAAKVELDARKLEDCAGVMAIRQVHRQLAPGAFTDSRQIALLRTFNQVSEDVNAALNHTSPYNQRRALQRVETRLQGVLDELTHSDAAMNARFRPIAGRWRNIVRDRVQELALAAEALQEINSPYVIGMPLTAQQEVFVGRTAVSGDIERFVQDATCPPLFLYGQRRMGKTSLLNNLGRLLPGAILPLFIDLQGPTSWAADHTGFLYSVAGGMAASAERQRGLLTLPPLSRERLQRDPFTRFIDWLNEVETALAGQGVELVLLALDEFEALDDALENGRFQEEAIFGLLRHLIQHRPRFKLLLAGSHTFAEFRRWAGYLINVRLLHLSYLAEAEARQLIERPIREFPLRYQPAASRRVLDLTRGHPFLVQLLCNEIVALKNHQDLAARRLATAADVDRAADRALAHGSLYFADIAQNQVDAAGLRVLRRLAETGTLDAAALGDLPDREDTLRALEQRELIEKVDGRYRFQVELVRRWFAEREE